MGESAVGFSDGVAGFCSSAGVSVGVPACGWFNVSSASSMVTSIPKIFSNEVFFAAKFWAHSCSCFERLAKGLRQIICFVEMLLTTTLEIFIRVHPCYPRLNFSFSCLRRFPSSSEILERAGHARSDGCDIADTPTSSNVPNRNDIVRTTWLSILRFDFFNRLARLNKRFRGQILRINTDR